MKLVILLVASLQVAVNSQREQQYCSISSEHNLCKFAGVNTATCGAPAARGVSAANAQRMLDEHNRLRSRVATGSEARGRPGPQPPAANMRKLKWDNELAKIAQRWVEQCQFKHDCNDCRKVLNNRFWYVGQNLYIASGGGDHYVASVRAWYEKEVGLFSRNNVNSYTFQAATGHYSAMVWADTEYVGCGYINYSGRHYVGCNYGNGGNIQTLPVYQTGTSCTKCPSGTRCSAAPYPGLCE